MAQTSSRVTRRQVLKASAATFAGYALVPDPAFAQAIKTDTAGLSAGDYTVRIGDYELPVYEARPASGRGHPILLVISEIWGVHEYIRDSTRRFAKEGFYAIAPELFKRAGGTAHLTDIQEILKIVLAQPLEQTLGDLKAAVDWAKTRPNVRPDRIGVTGWCWGGSTTIQVAARNPDIKAAVAWYGPPGRAYQTASGPVTGFDVAKDIKIPFLGLFGEKDTNPTPEDARRFGELLRQHNPNAQIVMFPAGHGFHADYRQSYHRESAEKAWRLCVDFFNKHLRA
ncbi:MAG TPA: dienelactone hydrolase family protein [Thermodesulfobacteriota bacterium]|nr:dienelactone hydrolase family protein [Thermodesulfobacteriota bacterium]